MEGATGKLGGSYPQGWIVLVVHSSCLGALTFTPASCEHGQHLPSAPLLQLTPLVRTPDTPAHPDARAHAPHGLLQSPVTLKSSAGKVLCQVI